MVSLGSGAVIKYSSKVRFNENHDEKGRFAESDKDFFDKGLDKSWESGIIKAGSGIVRIGMQFFAERDIQNQESSSLKRAIRKYEKRISEHKGYLNDPLQHCPEWNSYSEERKERLKKHWTKEISNFQESIEDRITELKKRGDFDE